MRRFFIAIVATKTGDRFLNVLESYAQLDWLELTETPKSCTLINLVWWFVDVSTTCSTFLPATRLSVNFQSCIFQPCTFVRHFPVLQIQRPIAPLLLLLANR